MSESCRVSNTDILNSFSSTVMSIKGSGKFKFHLLETHQNALILLQRGIVVQRGLGIIGLSKSSPFIELQTWLDFRFKSLFLFPDLFCKH